MDRIKHFIINSNNNYLKINDKTQNISYNVKNKVLMWYANDCKKYYVLYAKNRIYMITEYNKNDKKARDIIWNADFYNMYEYESNYVNHYVIQNNKCLTEVSKYKNDSADNKKYKYLLSWHDNGKLYRRLVYDYSHKPARMYTQEWNKKGKMIVNKIVKEKKGSFAY